MVKFTIASAEWNICTPTLFRFLDKEYVDAFFKDGTLRLSSFAQFYRHKDEQRQDKHEGEAYFVEQTREKSGQTIEIFSKNKNNSYILSSSMRDSKELAALFKCDSYIRVNESTSFGVAIARHIPNLIAAFEGPCNYQSTKMLIKETHEPPKDLEHFKNDSGLVDIGKLTKSVLARYPAHLPFFLKDNCYANQVEYRFVWVVNEKVEEPLSIKVPEAIQFCEQPNKLTE